LNQTSATELTVTGNIKTTADYLAIRKAVEDLVAGGARTLALHINQCFSMPSSVIGYFVKLTQRDRIQVAMVIEDRRLLELLQELSLAELFGARARD